MELVWNRDPLDEGEDLPFELREPQVGIPALEVVPAYDPRSVGPPCAASLKKRGPVMRSLSSHQIR